MVKSLKTRGFPAYTVPPAANSGGLFTVRVGIYRDRADAESCQPGLLVAVEQPRLEPERRLDAQQELGPVRGVAHRARSDRHGARRAERVQLAAVLAQNGMNAIDRRRQQATRRIDPFAEARHGLAEMGVGLVELGVGQRGHGVYSWGAHGRSAC